METVEQTPPPQSNTSFRPEIEDDETLPEPEESMEVDVATQPTGKDENRESKETQRIQEATEKLAECRVQQGPQWTNDELVRLMEVCELPRTW